MKKDKCPPLVNLYYGNVVDCYCQHQGERPGCSPRQLVTVWKEGEGSPTRVQVCPKLNNGTGKEAKHGL